MPTVIHDVNGDFTMSATNSSTPAPPSKPEKPTPDFPLFAHATKRWAKKIRGQLHYFGRWDDPDGALANYLSQREALHSGKTPADDDTQGLTVYQLAAKYLTYKQMDRDAGIITGRTFDAYGAVCRCICNAFGRGRLVADLRPKDFEQLRASWVKKGWGPVSTGGEIQRVRTIFKYGYDAGLIAQPLRFGPGFCKPGKKILRMIRAAKGRQMFEPEEILRMLDAANMQLRTMILLGINCGFGNRDCGKLPLAALDLARGWVDFPRPKTGIERRCPLWPETVAALKDVISTRPTPKSEGGEVFITKFGAPWGKGNTDAPLCREFRKLLGKLEINDARAFYCLRRGFETIGGEARDQVAVDHIMGHSRDDMATIYRQGISDERLKAVAAHVRTWLFTKECSVCGESIKPDEKECRACGKAAEGGPAILKLA
jgi:integrase